jgi:hypothetical protein
MARQVDVDLQVEYTPLPLERVPAWRESLLLLFCFIVEDCDAPEPVCFQEFIKQEVAHE